MYLIFSLHRPLILFVKKKDSSLWLYINFQKLNYIIQKDRYLHSLISNIFDSFWKLYIYIKIISVTYIIWCILLKVTKKKQLFATTINSLNRWLYLLVWLIFPNIPTVFWWFINNIFSDFLKICIAMYFNNTLIYLDNISQY